MPNQIDEIPRKQLFLVAALAYLLVTLLIVVLAISGMRGESSLTDNEKSPATARSGV